MNESRIPITRITPARVIRDAKQQARLVQPHAAGNHTISDLAELFSASRATVYRVLGLPA